MRAGAIGLRGTAPGRSVTAAGIIAALVIAAPSSRLAAAGAAVDLTPDDFAYRMQVQGNGKAAAYRLTLPVEVYKIAHPDLADIRVFNGSGEPVPFAIEFPEQNTEAAGAARTLPVFALQDDSVAALEALRVTIESGSHAINVNTSGQSAPKDRIRAYLVDARSTDDSKTPLSALELQWPEDAADFAGRITVEASDNLSDWRGITTAAPVANLHSASERLVERRVELSGTRAKYLRLTWVGSPPPFALTAVQAEPSKHSVDPRHASVTVTGTPVTSAPGEFEFDVQVRAPVERVNLRLPEINTVVEVELLSRVRASDPWRPIRRTGLYRLKSDGDELRNGPITVGFDSDRYWLARADRKGGGLGSGAPQLVVEWVPHDVVFVARGAAPFYVSYGSGSAESTAVSLAAIPKTLPIAPATLGRPQKMGGEARLAPGSAPFAWKTPLLWSVLLVAAALLAWMALRLFREFR
jgi:hypothetical protein